MYNQTLFIYGEAKRSETKTKTRENDQQLFDNSGTFHDIYYTKLPFVIAFTAVGTKVSLIKIKKFL